MHAEFSSEETAVVTELYERITVHCTKHGRRNHTNEEVDNVLSFWWKLQEYRQWWLVKEHCEGVAERTLSDEEIQAVKREWEWYDMWYELNEQQKRFPHLSSIFNAALNNRAG